MRAILFLVCLVLGNFAFAGNFADISIKRNNGLVNLLVPMDGQNKTYRGVPLTQRYAELNINEQFSILITPKVVPLGVVVVVDGCNVLTGKRVNGFVSREEMGRGFVLLENKTYVIAGWRETSQHIRRFKVVEQWQSLSFQLNNDMSHAGTIAISLFLPGKPHANIMDSPRTIFGNMGTSAGDRIYSPANLVSFNYAPRSCEIFALRYIGPQEAIRLKQRRSRTIDNGFIGVLPEQEW